MAPGSSKMDRAQAPGEVSPIEDPFSKEFGETLLEIVDPAERRATLSISSSSDDTLREIRTPPWERRARSDKAKMSAPATDNDTAAAGSSTTAAASAPEVTALPGTVPAQKPINVQAHQHAFDIINHGHKDLIKSIAFDTYGERCAAGAVDGRIRVFNRGEDDVWRLCDVWTAHPGEVLHLQWLPPILYPAQVGSLGIDGRFKIWAEDPSQGPGRRFSSRSGNGKAAFETRSTSRFPYCSFSIKHNDDIRHTYFAFLTKDGILSVYENEEPENITELVKLDEFQAMPRPVRGNETCFKVSFDPNVDPCYVAIKAGVPRDALSLVCSGLNTARVYRTRIVHTSSFGASASTKEFYLAAQLDGHGGLVRDSAWANGNIRGYDQIATACNDGFIRVFRLDATIPEHAPESWAMDDIESFHKGKEKDVGTSAKDGNAAGQHAQSSGIGAGLARSGTQGERLGNGQPGQVPHKMTMVSKLDTHRGPVWRCDFDADGNLLGTCGDEGKLMLHRQKPDGTWAKSSELGMARARMATPDA